MPSKRGARFSRPAAKPSSRSSDTKPTAAFIASKRSASSSPRLDHILSPNGWRAVTKIVLDGTFFCSREIATRRIAKGLPGAILNIGATYAFSGGPGAVHSAAAKAGVHNLTMTLAVEWAQHGIRVNELMPGMFPHDHMPPQLRANRPAGYGEASKQIPACRVGQLHELGWAATYPCSLYAAYVSGHTFVIDGANWLRRGLQMPEYKPVREQIRARPKS